MLSKKAKGARARCEHANTVTVRNSGIERTGCETCGNVSFRALEGLSGRASRAQFEREAERPQSTGWLA
jgi:hypothetical protein